MCSCLHHGPRLPTHAQGNLPREWVSHTPLTLYARPSRWHHYLEDTVYDMQSGVHGPPAFHHTLPPDAPGGRPRCLTSDAWRAEFGAVRRALPSLTHGAVSPRLRPWPPESRHGAHPMWTAAAGVFPGG